MMRIMRTTNLLKKQKPFPKIYCLVVFVFISATLFAQTDAYKIIDTLTTNADATQKIKPREKVFIQTDKTFYSNTDTLWLKAYLYNTYTDSASNISYILHVELIAPDHTIAQSLRLPVFYGTAFGQFTLDQSITPGIYSLRAYTNWNKNFENSLLFSTDITIAATGNFWLVNVVKDTAVQATDSSAMLLKLQNNKNVNIAFQKVSITAKQKGKKLWQSQGMTNADGELKLTAPLTAEDSSISFDITDAATNILKASTQLQFFDNDFDVQVMPEGGHLVSGLANVIAFKAVNKNGKGINFKGEILNGNSDTIALIHTRHLGMGTASLLPQAGENYWLNIDSPFTKRIAFPATDSAGIILNITPHANKNVVPVLITATNNVNDDIIFFAKYKGVALYSAIISLNKTKYAELKIPVEVLNAGVNSFCLIKTNGQLLSERAVFIKPQHILHADIKTSNASYAPHDSIGIEVKIYDENGEPAEGSFSVAVTDDNQVKKDTTNDESIISYMLLSSDVKGSVENAGYYFANDNDTTNTALDNLMLTQAWVKYDWDSSVKYDAEKAFEIKGRVAGNFFAKTSTNTHIALYGRMPELLVKDTLLGADGHFTFTDFPLFDTADFIIQALNKNNKKVDASVTIDEFQPAIISQVARNKIAWNVNTSAENKQYLQQSLAYNEALLKSRDSGFTLQDVVVTTAAPIQGSHNLNGAGKADIIVNTEELKKLGKRSLLQLLMDSIPGFQRGNSCFPENKLTYLINTDKVIRFVFDGKDLDYYYQTIEDPAMFVNSSPVGRMSTPQSTVPGRATPLEYFQFINSYLNNYTAEDIKGIEVMTSARYKSAYYVQGNNFSDPLYLKRSINCDYVFIEITTYAGNGPSIKREHGLYRFFPKPFFLGKQFYSPRYSADDTTHVLPDTRSTIYWKANIITDTKGKAKFYFSAADKAGNYTLNLQGTDLKDGWLNKYLSIKINDKKKE